MVLKFSLLVCLVLFSTLRAHTHEEEPLDEQYSYVTCGSIIKLINQRTNTRLHSHQVSYGNSGSGQQSVTGMTDLADSNSLWIVEGEDEDSCPRGKPIENGAFIRLKHLATETRLHSHLHKSPLTKQQEVSCFDKGDSGDVWQLLLENRNSHWKREEPFALKHLDTGKFLATTQAKYGNPIPGQHEVCAIIPKNSETIWVADEGFYFERVEESK